MGGGTLKSKIRFENPSLTIFIFQELKNLYGYEQKYKAEELWEALAQWGVKNNCNLLANIKSSIAPRPGDLSACNLWKPGVSPYGRIEGSEAPNLSVIVDPWRIGDTLAIDLTTFIEGEIEAKALQWLNYKDFLHPLTFNTSLGFSSILAFNLNNPSEVMTRSFTRDVLRVPVRLWDKGVLGGSPIYEYMPVVRGSHNPGPIWTWVINTHEQAEFISRLSGYLINYFLIKSQMMKYFAEPKVSRELLQRSEVLLEKMPKKEGDDIDFMNLEHLYIWGGQQILGHYRLSR